MNVTKHIGMDGHGKPLHFFKVEDSEFEVLFNKYVKNNKSSHKGHSLEEIRAYNLHLQSVNDWIPVLEISKIKYMNSPKEFMFYSPSLNEMRFPNIGEYYSASNFVD